MKEHRVNVYDENNVKLEDTMMPVSVAYVTRDKHVMCKEIVYSFNSHLYNGLTCLGMIPMPPFKIDLKC